MNPVVIVTTTIMADYLHYIGIPIRDFAHMSQI